MNTITKYTGHYFRMVLVFAFLGHALVNLGLSPSVELHKNIILSVFPDSTNLDFWLLSLSFIEFLFVIVLSINFFPRLFLPLELAYLSLVGVSGWLFYFDQSGSVFGFAEIMRRFPWLFFLLFLLLLEFKGVSKYFLLRIGILEMG